MTKTSNVITKTMKTSVAALAMTTLAALPVATGVTLLSADTAVAAPKDGKGGNRGGGNRGGNANRGGNSSSAREAGSQGSDRAASVKGGARGVIARELGGMNAANTSPTALANASPNSMPGKLYTYQQTGGLTIDDITEINDARTSYNTLVSMSEDDVLATYDADGDGELSDEEAETYDADLSAAKTDVDALESEFGDAYAALAAVRDGSLTLSAAALAELNAMLGL